MVDANVLLEVFLSRAKLAQATAVLHQETASYELTVSSLSVSHFMYFVEIAKESKTKAREFMNNYFVLDVNDEDVEWAFENDQGNFEDALQAACAIRNGCSKVITLDQFFAASHQKHIPITHIR